MKKLLFLFFAIALFISSCTKPRKDTPKYYTIFIGQTTGMSFEVVPTEAMDGQTGVLAGTVVTITTSVENNNYEFGGWKGRSQPLGLTDLNVDDPDLILEFVMPKNDIVFAPVSSAKPKYRLTARTNFAELNDVIQNPDGRQLSGTEITLTAPAPNGCSWVGWTLDGISKISGDLTDKTITVSMPANNNGVATANYFSPCPTGEIAIEMSESTVIWAASNLANTYVFAENDYDFGRLFQWGYRDAIKGSDETTFVTTLPHDDNQQGTVWPHAENPCPAGWRVPTGRECRDLIGCTDSNFGDGVADGIYTRVSWTTGMGENTGLKISPKAGDTNKVLVLPNAGYRSGGMSFADGTAGRYWSSVQSDIMNTPYLLFDSGEQAGRISAQGKLEPFSVRCVR